MDSESSQQFCLRWHNHQSSVLGGLPALLDSGRLTDVTLCAGGRSLRAHRIVLSTCSPYFMDIFKELPPTQQPVVVILGGGWAELCCLVAFMYAGEVTLPRTLLPSLLRLARALQITGLTDLNGNIPEVPMQSEYDDSFNSKFETTFSTYDEMRFSRQNSDSASCTETVSSLQKTFDPRNQESPSSRFDGFNPQIFQDSVYQELELLKQLSKQCISDKVNETTDDKTPSTTHKKQTRNKSKYLNPVLNELEPKNRKIDKIVENLKLKTQETNAETQNLDRVSGAGKVEPADKSKAEPSTSTKVADIFASNNIFMETDTENASDVTLESLVPNVKLEPDSSPELLSELKYVPLSPGIQPASSQTANTKLYATCYVCHKRLSNQYNLRVHLETHQNARHACIACNHVSRSRDALRKHVSYRHPQLNISHSVGRPCKSAQNTPTSSNTNTNIFNFPSTSTSDTSALSKNNTHCFPVDGNPNPSTNKSDKNTNPQ